MRRSNDYSGEVLMLAVFAPIMLLFFPVIKIYDLATWLLHRK